MSSSEIKRIAESREAVYYDGHNGQFIANVFFGGGGYTFVSEIDGVLTVYNSDTSSNQVIPAGNFVIRDFYGDTSWNGLWSPESYYRTYKEL